MARQLSVFLLVFGEEEHVCEFSIHQVWVLPAHHNQIKALASAVSAAPESAGSLVVPCRASVPLCGEHVQGDPVEGNTGVKSEHATSTVKAGV